MTKREAQKLDHGLYRIYWKSGGVSEAAVGSLYDGTRWFAPTNWTAKTTDGIVSTAWRRVDHTEYAD